MLSVNQMFYGTDEPVWLVDGSSPSPVKYHYVGSAHREPRRSRDPHYPYDGYYDSRVPDPRYGSVPRREYSPSRSRSARQPSYYNAAPPPPAPMATETYSSANPPPAPMVVPIETPITHTPVVPVVDRPAVPPNTPYTLLLKVPICCEGCERRVVKRLLKVPGVATVRCDVDRQRVTVRGTADTDEVLKEAKTAFKKSRLW
ncbi:unnamed protein product [Calypogeia fissa]